jgi:hypothetical protein
MRRRAAALVRGRRPAPTTAPPRRQLRTATSTTTRRAPDDGVLRIGILLPESGDGAAIGKPLIDAALRRRDAINAAGGVLGAKIEVVGTSTRAAAAHGPRAIATLARAGRRRRRRTGLVDDRAGDAAAADGRRDPDVLADGDGAGPRRLPDRELFFRTAPSDSLQASAIAEQAERTGALSALVVYLDDAYGRPLADATIDRAARPRPRRRRPDRRSPRRRDPRTRRRRCARATAGCRHRARRRRAGHRMIARHRRAPPDVPGEDARRSSSTTPCAGRRPTS